MHGVNACSLNVTCWQRLYGVGNTTIIISTHKLFLTSKSLCYCKIISKNKKKVGQEKKNPWTEDIVNILLLRRGDLKSYIIEGLCQYSISKERWLKNFTVVSN